MPKHDLVNKFIWQFMFKKHRERIDKVKSRVDHRPPLVHAFAYVRWGRMRQDGETCKNLVKNNLSLNEDMNRVFRTRGKVYSFQTNSVLAARSKVSSWNYNLQHLQRKNVEFGNRLLGVRSNIDSRPTPSFQQKQSERRKSIKFAVPSKILEKYENLALPRSVDILRRLLRPKIYFDLELKGIRPLGRLVIQLFTEACPQVVLEFVRACSGERKDKMRIVRLFPSLWMEGALMLENTELSTPDIEYDMRALNHGESSGILSFAKQHTRGFQNGILSYAISFKKLSVLNGKRVGFGSVVKGLKVLDCMQDYGNRDGRPKSIISVQRMGVVR